MTEVATVITGSKTWVLHRLLPANGFNSLNATCKYESNLPRVLDAIGRCVPKHRKFPHYCVPHVSVKEKVASFKRLMDTNVFKIRSQHVNYKRFGRHQYKHTTFLMRLITTGAAFASLIWACSEQKILSFDFPSLLFAANPLSRSMPLLLLLVVSLTSCLLLVANRSSFFVNLFQSWTALHLI